MSPTPISAPISATISAPGEEIARARHAIEPRRATACSHAFCTGVHGQLACGIVVYGDDVAAPVGNKICIISYLRSLKMYALLNCMVIGSHVVLLYPATMLQRLRKRKYRKKL